MLTLSADREHGRDGRFGTLTITPTGNGTATYTYRRNTWETTPATEVTRNEDYPVVVAGRQGPADAFYVRVSQNIDGKTVDTYQKVVVHADDALNGEDVLQKMTLKDGVLTPLAGTDPSAGGGPGGAPVVLDFNGDGFAFTAVGDSAAFYDMAGDGVRRATAWVSRHDALLAYDANNDGNISGKNEINFTGYRAGATTDLQGLRAFDTNGDGLLSAADAQWGRFKVWQDKNEDGEQTADELTTLAQRGITSLSLTADTTHTSAAGVTSPGASGASTGRSEEPSSSTRRTKNAIVAAGTLSIVNGNTATASGGAYR